MKYRAHKGGIQESLATTVEVFSINELVDVISKQLYACIPDDCLPRTKVIPSDIEIKFYAHDARLGEDVFIVTCESYVVGFSDCGKENLSE